MPSRAARWISWIVLRSKTADSRRPGCQDIRSAPCRGRAGRPLVLPGVVDVEVVETARRPVAAELRRLRIGHAGAREQVAQLGAVLVAQVLLDAVGAEAAHRPAHVEPRLVDRVPERVTRVAAHD